MCVCVCVFVCAWNLSSLAGCWFPHYWWDKGWFMTYFDTFATHAQPCSRHLRRTLLGTKWQCCWLCFHDFDTLIFKKTGPEIELETVVCLFHFLFLLIRPVMLLRFWSLLSENDGIFFEAFLQIFRAKTCEIPCIYWNIQLISTVITCPWSQSTFISFHFCIFCVLNVL